MTFFSRFFLLLIVTFLSTCLTLFLIQSSESFVPDSKPSLREDVDVVSMVKNYQDSVVQIKGGEKDRFPHYGTGFWIEWEGKYYVLTNEHVISTPSSLALEMDGKVISDVSVVGLDVDTDLALLTIPKKDIPSTLQPLPFATSHEPRLGEPLVAMGYPLNLGFTVTTGILSGHHKSFSIGEQFYSSLLQTDASINPGNSGGPLFNQHGEVVGVNTAVSTEGTGIGFAIPVSTIQRIVPTLISEGKVDRPFIGIQYSVENNQVFILGIVENSPAAQAGIQKGDVLLKMGDRDVRSISDILTVLEGYRIGDKIELIVEREKKRKNFTLTLSSKLEHTDGTEK